MPNQPFYHLRPNKCIDRKLFVQTLIGISQLISLSDYQYVGFGSYLFDDFKAIHDTLNISNMTSLECDPSVFERAKYNVPYSCIDIRNATSTEYISRLVVDDNSHGIYWLDYVDPAEIGVQLSDYSTLINKLNANDIVRITVNANPSSLGTNNKPDELHEYRFERLRERVPEKYIPSGATPENLTTNEYPILLLKIIKAATIEVLEDRPPFKPNFMLPLFSSVYADGQQMLTFTGIILDSHEKEERAKEVLSSFTHNTFSWDKPCRIEIPALTVREISDANKLLPNADARQRIVEALPFVFSNRNGAAVDSYTAFYKYYPNYHQVSL